MKGFAAARVERIIRGAGAYRVSANAIEKLNEIITAHGTDIASKAVNIAQHSGRKTIKGTDIKLAHMQLG
jgi:histone H3/H4